MRCNALSATLKSKWPKVELSKLKFYVIMRNIKVTLENKVNHILKSFNIKAKIGIEFVEGKTVDATDDFTGEPYQETYPDEYEITIPVLFDEKLFVALDRMATKITKKNDFNVDINFLIE